MEQTSIKDILIKIVHTNWNDETEIHADSYSVRLFPMTTISSAFECFEVHIVRSLVNVEKYDIPDVFVVKISQEKDDREGKILQNLNERGFHVPKIYERIMMRNNGESYNIILEEFIPGVTLFKEGSSKNWLKFAIALADFHKILWNMNTGIISPKIRNRVNVAYLFCNQYRRYETAFKTAIRIVNKSTKTFLHGDLVPTNVMLSGKQVKFVDLNDGGTDSYAMDIARAISCVDPVSIERCCPFQDKFCVTYYNAMKDLFGSYEPFMREVHAAEFLECAAMAYGGVSTGITGTTERAYANYMLARVDELAVNFM